MGMQDAVYNCRTIRRKTDDIAYDPTCVDSIKTDDIASRTPEHLPQSLDIQGGPIDPVPTRGREFVPRRIYTRPADFERHR